MNVYLFGHVQVVDGLQTKRADVLEQQISVFVSIGMRLCADKRHFRFGKFVNLFL